MVDGIDIDIDNWILSINTLMQRAGNARSFLPSAFSCDVLGAGLVACSRFDGVFCPRPVLTSSTRQRPIHTLNLNFVDQVQTQSFRHNSPLF